MAEKKDDGLDELRYFRRKRQRTREGSKGLTCFICNDHNEALKCIHVAIRRRLLPFENNVLIHIDSHPDLMIPENLVYADDIFDNHKLYEVLETSEAGIAEFIQPAIYAKHINQVSWIRPPWSDQIRDGSFEFDVGKHVGTGKLKLSCKEPYFFDEGNYAPSEQLECKQRVRLLVTPIAELQDPTCLLKEGQAWVLDICLDYFSVNNPFSAEFKALAGEEVWSALCWIYGLELSWRRVEECRVKGSRDGPKDYANQVRWKSIFEALMSELVKAVMNERKVDAETRSALSECYRNPKDARVKVEKFVNLLENAGRDVVKHVLSTGEMLDLPEHISSWETIETMVNEVGNVLNKIKTPPRIITIARSSSDEFDYTPKDQVQRLEDKLLALLTARWGTLFIERG